MGQLMATIDDTYYERLVDIAIDTLVSDIRLILTEVNDDEKYSDRI